jgi:prepilin-type N-terminal cleavage/methylation domain-containing protein
MQASSSNDGPPHGRGALFSNNRRLSFSRRTYCGFTLVELLVVIAMIGILVALLLPAIQAAREASRRSSCQNKIRQLAIAVQNFESAKKHLPAAVDSPEGKSGGNEGISFYIQILPYIEQSTIADLYDPNIQPRKQLAKCFSTPEPTMQCPTDEPVQVLFAQGYTPPDPATGLGTGDTAQDYKGNYGINWGTSRFDQDELVWDFAAQANRPGLPGPFENTEVVGTGANAREVPQRIKIKQITDGTTKTLLFMEMRQAPTGGPSEGDAGIDRRARLWIPASSTFQISTLLLPNSGPCGSGLSVDAKTGCGRDIGFCIDRAADGLHCMRSNTASQYTLAARSRHPSGVSVALCDASVRFVADDVDIQIWRGFGSRAGQEIGGEL